MRARVVFTGSPEALAKLEQYLDKGSQGFTHCDGALSENETLTAELAWLHFGVSPLDEILRDNPDVDFHTIEQL